MRESKRDRTARAGRILARLKRLYPDVRCELDHRDPFQLLVATILSAQTTDKAVNRITPDLFARYPDAESLAAADPVDVEPLIASIGLFRNKAKSIVGAARGLVERFGGDVPRERDALESLPGVGRKTANVVLPNAFGVPGLAVDTHVARLAGRLRLSRARTPLAIERDLTALYDDGNWGMVSHLLIWHGRRVCDARRPRCAECAIAGDCPSAGRARPGTTRLTAERRVERRR